MHFGGLFIYRGFLRDLYLFQHLSAGKSQFYHSENLRIIFLVLNS